MDSPVAPDLDLKLRRPQSLLLVPLGYLRARQAQYFVVPMGQPGVVRFVQSAAYELLRLDR